MGKVLKFRRKNRIHRRSGPGGRSRKLAAFAIGGFLLGGFGAAFLIGAIPAVPFTAPDLVCASVRVIDGDTFDCDSTRIRMEGIDAPEMPGHCRRGRDCTPGDPYASEANLRRLVQSGAVQCRKTDTDRYGRTVARCHAGEVDLSCKQIEGGFAVRRYSGIWCD